jgi:hypothetical protein
MIEWRGLKNIKKTRSGGHMPISAKRRLVLVAGLACLLGACVSNTQMLQPVTDNAVQGLSGKEVSVHSGWPACSSESIGKLTDIAPGHITLNGWQKFETKDICRIEYQQSSLHPLAFAGEAIAYVIALPIMLIAAIAGSPCMLADKC